MQENLPRPTNNPEDKPDPIENLQEGEVMLDFLQQEPTEDYSLLIQQAERNVFSDERALRTNYSGVWDPYSGMRERKEDIIAQHFSEAIPESILCDLGGHNGATKYLAGNHNASAYINVDRYPRGLKDDTPVDATKGVFEKREYIGPLSGTRLIEGIHNVINVRADMLDFVSRLKDASVNITINGIDGNIIPVEEYHKALAKEILRVTKRNGIIFGHGSFPVISDILKLVKTHDLLKEEFNVIYLERSDVVVRRK
jgi:hypothetical protein